MPLGVANSPAAMIWNEWSVGRRWRERLSHSQTHFPRHAKFLWPSSYIQGDHKTCSWTELRNKQQWGRQAHCRTPTMRAGMLLACRTLQERCMRQAPSMRRARQGILLRLGRRGEPRHREPGKAKRGEAERDEVRRPHGERGPNHRDQQTHNHHKRTTAAQIIKACTHHGKKQTTRQTPPVILDRALSSLSPPPSRIMRARRKAARAGNVHHHPTQQQFCTLAATYTMLHAGVWGPTI